MFCVGVSLRNVIRCRSLFLLQTLDVSHLVQLACDQTPPNILSGAADLVIQSFNLVTTFHSLLNVSSGSESVSV